MDPNQLLDLSTSLPPSTYNSTSGASLFTRSNTAPQDDWLSVRDREPGFYGAVRSNTDPTDGASSPNLTRPERAAQANTNPFLHSSEFGYHRTGPDSIRTRSMEILGLGQRDDDLTPPDAPPSYSRHATNGARTLEGGPPGAPRQYIPPTSPHISHTPHTPHTPPAHGMVYGRYSPAPPNTHGSPILPLTFQDLGPEGRQSTTPMLEHGTREIDQRWRKRRIYGGIGCCWGGRTHGAAGEKPPMSRRRKGYILSAIFFFSLAIITFAIVGNKLAKGSSESSTDKTTANSSSSPSQFPELPLGALDVTPYAKARTNSSCAAKTYYWSCMLPVDTKYPSTRSTLDHALVPEFRFMITKNSRLANSAQLSSPITPPPSDYASVSQIDGVKSTPFEGQESDYLISQVPLSEGRLSSTSTDDLVRPASDTLPGIMSNQTLRLFDRGTVDEHYGAHIYFNKSIHFANELDDEVSDYGGTTSAKARYKIIFAKTRFKIKIYTKTELQLNAKQLVNDDRKMSPTTLPIEIWEDRPTGNGRLGDGSNSVTIYKFNKSGTLVSMKQMGEIAEADSRGCSCTWANFRLP